MALGLLLIIWSVFTSASIRAEFSRSTPILADICGGVVAPLLRRQRYLDGPPFFYMLKNNSN
jgi:hypothetical protein